MHCSETAIVTGPESVVGRRTVAELEAAGMNVRRAARSAEVESLASTLRTFDVLITLPLDRELRAAAIARSDGDNATTAEIEHVLRCVQPAIRRMSEAGRGGRVVTVVSDDIEIDVLTNVLAGELSEVGICVNSVTVGSDVPDSDVCDIITYLAVSAAGRYITGSSYATAGNALTASVTRRPSTRGERPLPLSVRSRISSLHSSQEH